MTSNLLDKVGGGGVIFCLGCDNCHVKSHRAVHLTSARIFMDLTIRGFKKCYVSGVNDLIPSGIRCIFEYYIFKAKRLVSYCFTLYVCF